jgi:hypothetical protein
MSGLNVRAAVSRQGAKWQISSEAVSSLAGGATGAELLHDLGDRWKLMAVDQGGKRRFSGRSARRVLFDSGYVNLSSGGNYHTAVSRDGQRFLIPRPCRTLSTPFHAITVVLNWAAAIK